MNLIFIVTDTLRPDFIGAYGNDRIKTPNLDAFSRRSVIFTRCHGEGLPTVPARKVFLTGHDVLPFDDTPPLKGLEPTMAGWRPLKEEDVTLADFLLEQGYYNGMVTDLWHLIKPNMNYQRNFHTWDFIRGQERDSWRPGRKFKHDIRNHLPEHLILPKTESFLDNYLCNTEWFQGEEDYFVARTMRSAVRWLENCRDRTPFFLYVDTFDPHEVFDAPRHYLEMYHDNYPFERPLYPYGINRDAITDEDLLWIKGLYSAKVSLVDTWVGFFLNAVERIGLMEDTVIVFTSDHGTEFMEHGMMCKSPKQLYSTVTQLPLMVRVPGAEVYAGKKIDALVSAVDIAPTSLQLIGKTPPSTMTGKNLWSLVTGETDSLREHLLSGYGRSGAVRTLEWLFHTRVQPNAKYGERGESGETPPRLFELTKDPQEKVDVVDKYPEVRKKLWEIARSIWPDALL